MVEEWVAVARACRPMNAYRAITVTTPSASDFGGINLPARRSERQLFARSDTE
jgi:hypothetical protein